MSSQRVSGQGWWAASQAGQYHLVTYKFVGRKVKKKVTSYSSSLQPLSWKNIAMASYIWVCLKAQECICLNRLLLFQAKTWEPLEFKETSLHTPNSPHFWIICLT